ncbi:MAG: hypothetical protein ACRD63_03030, partial [Pyrinomonadaceae bacterium]
MSQYSKLTKRPILQYGILALIFLITAAYQIRHVFFVVGYMSGRIQSVEYPIGIGSDSPLITYISEEAKKSGVRSDDTLVAINARVYRSYTDLVRAVEYARPSDLLTVTVRHKNSKPAEETVRIPLARRVITASDQWFFVIPLDLLLPLFCVVLGFWVVLIRPRDPLAWLLLALLLGFSQVLGIGVENQDGTPGSNLAFTYKLVFRHTWPIWLFLLGLYFPSRLSFERRVPWLKWLLIVPLSILSIMQIIIVEGLLRDYTFVDNIPALLNSFNNLTYNNLPLTAIVLFFVTIGAKYFLEQTPDAKRRLRLLYVGSSLALLPTLALILIGHRIEKSLNDFPAWIQIPSLLLLLLFPITLAYLIVIHKAMDVSVVIRQGVQYALARGGVTFLQMLLTASLIITISLVVASRSIRLPQIMMVVSVSVAVIFLMRRAAMRIARWIDRRFFRE